jgi:protection-of-telomeres protein 1
MPCTSPPLDNVCSCLQPQMNRGLVDLIASKWSEFHIIPASNLPTVASAYGPNLWQSFPPTNCSRPVPAETAYFIKVNGNTEALELPTALEFEQRIQQAKRVKEKFSLLKDVEADQFYDILVQVIRLYDEGNPSTLYVSDYTANSKFYEYVFGEKAPSTTTSNLGRRLLKSSGRGPLERWRYK